LANKKRIIFTGLSALSVEPFFYCQKTEGKGGLWKMCKVIAIVNRKGGCAYGKLQIMQSSLPKGLVLLRFQVD
jgi:hypothetical protein